MDAKGKAKELYDKFEKIFIDANADSWGEEAKQAVLICVDEILGNCANPMNPLNDKDFDFWIEVKEAITHH